MDNIRYYEVELSFTSPNMAIVPVTAATAQEAAEIALTLFAEHPNLEVRNVKDVHNQITSPRTLPPVGADNEEEEEFKSSLLLN